MKPFKIGRINGYGELTIVIFDNKKIDFGFRYRHKVNLTNLKVKKILL
jgi:hypothetical protein